MHIIIGVPLIMAVLSFLLWFLVYVLIFGWIRGVWRKLTGKYKPAPPQSLPREPELFARPTKPIKLVKPITARIVRETPAIRETPAEPPAPVDWSALKPNLSGIKRKALSLVPSLPRKTARPDTQVEAATVAVPAAYHIAKDGEELGTMSVPAIKKMLAGGGLTPQDYFFDAAANEWKPLDTLPGLG